MSSDIALREYDYEDFQISRFIDGFWNSDKEILREKHKIIAKNDEVISFFREKLSDYLICQSHNTMLFRSPNCIISVNYSERGMCSVRIFGTQDEVARAKNLFQENFKEVGSKIEWVYNSKGSSISLPINRDYYPIKEFYPFLGSKSLEEYYDDYMSSKASIMILIGPPGTGKTTFLRGLVCHTKATAYLTYDPKVLENDDFFVDFIRDDAAQFLILEDADNFLAPRKEGNMLMMKFLNVGEGLVSSSNKKIIFTTNLPSIKEIDSALIRPGRCYDIIQFSNLSAQEANLVAQKLNMSETFTEEKTLAEIFNTRQFLGQQTPRTFGLVK